MSKTVFTYHASPLRIIFLQQAHWGIDIPVVTGATLVLDLRDTVLHDAITPNKDRPVTPNLVKPRPYRSRSRILNHYTIIPFFNPLDPFQLRLLKPRDRGFHGIDNCSRR